MSAYGGTRRLFGLAMAWTVVTSIFAWLPIVRALSRPDGYTWALFGLRGEGLSGPFWIFPLLATYAIVLFSHAWWARRGLFRTLLLAWHLGWTSLIVAGVVQGGVEAQWQGQGWGWSVSLVVPAIVFTCFTAIVAWWAILDGRRASAPPRPAWTAGNTGRLIVALALFPVAFTLFRYGSDYDWITAAAIGVAIVQWVTLYEALVPRSGRAAESPRPD